MTKKITTIKIVESYAIINAAPLYNVKDKVSVLKLLRVLKPIATSFDDLRNDTQEKLKPQNWDELVEKYKDDKSVLNDYINEVNAYLATELNKEVELEFEPLTDETICELITDKVSAGVALELAELYANG